ncbi:ATP-dependent RNA helicase [Entamoeba marina]
MSVDSYSSSWRNQEVGVEVEDDMGVTLIEVKVKHKFSQIQTEVFMKKLNNLTLGKPAQQSNKVQQFRQSLPAYEFRNNIISNIRNNQVVIISGDTGCGKSTQVTQYLLEDALEHNERIHIACTQPRRIAATSLAERVSDEVGCRLGYAVGYQIGLEKKCDEDTNIVYLTPGVLLQQLMRSKDRVKYSHIIIDEAHERDIDTEFCLMLIRKYLPTTQTRLVIMSAMMNVNLFQQHFTLINNPLREDVPMELVTNNRFNQNSPMDYLLCNFLDQSDLVKKQLIKESPILHVGGKRFEVQQKYLEDVFNTMKCNKHDVYNKEDIEFIFSKQYPLLDVRTVQLGVDLIFQIMSQQNTFITILVFLPGMSEIEEMNARIAVHRNTRNIKFVVRRLHSSISMVEQRQIFDNALAHKIILSSNIAESSITVPGVKVVINFGLEKSLLFDPSTNVEALKLMWISTASETQRVGRAGRVCEGICYHMYPRPFARDLRKYAVPEIQRASLEKILLLLFEMGEGVELLSYGVEPPSLKHIERSHKNLLRSGLVYKYGNQSKTTPLGSFAVKLPLDYRVSKLVFFSIYFDCYYPAARVASLFNTNETIRRDPLLVTNDRIRVDKLYSDVLTLLNSDLVNRRDANALFNELTQRIFPDQRDQKRYATSARYDETSFQLAFYAAFFPNYFGSFSSDIRSSEAISLSCKHHKIDPWRTIAFRGIPDSVTNADLEKQLRSFFFRLFNTNRISKIVSTDRFRLIEFYEFRGDIQQELYPWPRGLKNVFLALTYLSQKSFYCYCAGSDQPSIRCYAQHAYNVSLSHYFTTTPAKIDGSSCLSGLISPYSSQSAPQEPDYTFCSGLISESNSGSTMCRRLSMLPRAPSYSHLPLLSLLFAPSPVTAFYNNKNTKLKAVIFAHCSRPVMLNVYFDDETLVSINNIRKDIRRFVLDFNSRNIPSRCRVMGQLQKLLNTTYRKMPSRHMTLESPRPRFEYNDVYAYHPFEEMAPLESSMDLDLSENDEAVDASLKIDHFMQMKKICEGWYPEKALLCAVCKREVCKMKNVKPPSKGDPSDVIGTMTFVFGLIKTGDDPRIGCCMAGHPICRKISNSFTLTEESKVFIQLPEGDVLPWERRFYDNFFNSIGGVNTLEPNPLPRDKLDSFTCSLCSFVCFKANEFLEHLSTSEHHSAEQRYRSIYKKR